MTTEPPVGDSIQEHALLRTLRARGATAKVVFGYAGAGDTADSLVLYPSLYDLSQSLEISRADILHVEELPKQVMPFGAIVLWVRSDATIVRRKEERLAHVHGSPAKAAAAAGRLRIDRRGARMTAGIQEDWDPNCTSCHSPCSTCHTDCSVCISTCRVEPPTEM